MDDFYSFDGSRAVSIGDGLVHREVFTQISFSNLRLCATLHDSVNSRVYFYYPTESSLTKCVVYNYQTKRWGRDDRSIECCANYIASGITYDQLGTYYSTYNDLPNTSYDANFLISGSPVPIIFNTSHVMQSLSGVATTSSFTTGDLGEEEDYSLVSRVRPLFLRKPTSSQLTNYYRDNLGDALTTDATTSLSEGQYDLLRSSRWHRLKFNFVGDWEMAYYNVYAKKEGVA